MVYPVIKSLALSFYDFEGGDYLFCGINNYVTMCKDPVFWKSLGNTFIYLAIQVPVMSIPFRYMHNPAEVCSMEDVQGCIDVLAEFLCGIGSDICLKPLEG